MTREIPNFGVPDDTLVAVVLGALLATLGGFLAARFEAWLRRRERSGTPPCCWARSSSPSSPC